MAEFYIFNNGLMTENTMSGSDQRALNWSRIFSQHGHRVSVFTSAAGAVRFKPLGFTVCVTGKSFLKSNIGLFLVYLSRAIKSCLLQLRLSFEQDGVIYSSSDLLADAVPAVFMKFRKPAFKLVVGMHLIAPNPFKGFRKSHGAKGLRVPSLSNMYYFLFQRLLIFVLKKKASLVLVSNCSDRNFLLKRGLSAARTLVTYGACDASFEDAVLDAPKAYEAIYIGRFHEQKGFPDLLRIWKEVSGEFPDARLIVLGEDITARNIETLIHKYGRGSNIEFLGFVGGSRKYEYLKASRVCILPSYYESFGIVALEAMACGVPVAAYDLAVFSEIYSKGMFRAPVGDINSMARNIIELLRNDQKRRSISKEALDMSRQFSWNNTAKDILRKLGL